MILLVLCAAFSVEPSRSSLSASSQNSRIPGDDSFVHPLGTVELLTWILCDSGLEELKDLKAASQVSSLWFRVVREKLNRKKLEHFGYDLTPPLPYENLSKTWYDLMRFSRTGLFPDDFLRDQKEAICTEIYERAYFFIDDTKPRLIAFSAALGCEKARKAHMLGLYYGRNGFKADPTAFHEVLYSYAQQGSLEANTLIQEGLIIGLYGLPQVPGLLDQIQSDLSKNIALFRQILSPLGPLSVYNAS